MKPTDVYLFRVAQMLDDYAVRGAVLRRYSRTVGKLSADQADTLARFRASLQAGGCAVSTVRAYGTARCASPLRRWTHRSQYRIPHRPGRDSRCVTAPRADHPARGMVARERCHR